MDIKMLVMDVDGTLTDGKIYFGSEGEVFKAFNVRDGYALIKCPEYGILTAIITGRKSKIVESRARELKINFVYQGVQNKAKLLKKLIDEKNLKCEDVAYIGDDVNDIDCMKICAISACPGDAMDEVKKNASYVCSCKGGDGAVREFIDKILELEE